jgi:hypothetical protein
VLGARAGWLAIQWLAANRVMLLATIKTWAPILLKVGLVAAAIGTVVVFVEDLFTLFSGGKSIIGDFIDSLFGIGTAEQVILSIKQAFQDVVFWAEKAAAAIGLGEGPQDDSPEAARERRKNEAVAKGDVEGFLGERSSGTREEGLDNFRESRKRYLSENPNAATENDIGDGLIDPRVAKAAKSASVSIAPTSASAPKSARAQVTVGGPTIQVNLPPGSDREQAERMRRIAEEELHKHHRRAVAAAKELGT